MSWLAERSFGEILCLLVVGGAILTGTIQAVRGR